MVSTTLESVELGFVLGEVLATDYVKSRQRLLHQLEVMISVVEDALDVEDMAGLAWGLPLDLVGEGPAGQTEEPSDLELLRSLRFIIVHNTINICFKAQKLNCLNKKKTQELKKQYDASKHMIN